MRVRINRLRYIHDPLWCCSLDIIGGLYPYNPSIFHRRNPGIIQSKWDKILLRVYPSSQRFFAGRKFHVLFAKTKAPRVLNNTQNYPTTLTLLSVLSSGKLTKSDGKSPSLIRKSTIYIYILIYIYIHKWAIFNSYVKLPEDMYPLTIFRSPTHHRGLQV